MRDRDVSPEPVSDEPVASETEDSEVEAEALLAALKGPKDPPPGTPGDDGI